MMYLSHEHRGMTHEGVALVIQDDAWRGGHSLYRMTHEGVALVIQEVDTRTTPVPSSNFSCRRASKLLDD